MKIFLVWVFLSLNGAPWVNTGTLGPYDTLDTCMINAYWWIISAGEDLKDNDRLRTVCNPSDWGEPDPENPREYKE